MADITFRDFAGAMMQGRQAEASTMLADLLGLPPAEATKATAVFGEHLKNPAAMPKAMGLRAAVERGSDDDIATMLGEVFGLTEKQRPAAVAALRKRYPAGG